MNNEQKKNIFLHTEQITYNRKLKRIKNCNVQFMNGFESNFSHFFFVGISCMFDSAAYKLPCLIYYCKILYIRNMWLQFIYLKRVKCRMHGSVFRQYMLYYRESFSEDRFLVSYIKEIIFNFWNTNIKFIIIFTCNKFDRFIRHLYQMVRALTLLFTTLYRYKYWKGIWLLFV